MMTIDFQRNNFEIAFEYDAMIVADVKVLPMASFKGEKKVWAVPKVFARAVAEFSREHRFTVTEKAKKAMWDIANKENYQVPDVGNLDAPLENGRTLFTHQKEGILWLVKKRRAILADDMGLGKTLQALIAAKAFSAPVHVICPVTVGPNWHIEAEMVGMKVQTHSWARVPPPPINDYVVIADEAHYAQSGNRSQRGEAFLDLSLSEKCVAVFCLTGTPMKNGRPANFYPLLKAIQHPLAHGKSAFEKRYCNAKATRFTRWDISGAINLVELHSLTKDAMLRRTKAECLDLPPKTRSYRQFDWSDFEMKEFKEVIHRRRAEYDEKVATGKIQGGSDALALLGHIRTAASIAKVRLAANMAYELIEEKKSVVIFTSSKEAALNCHKMLPSFHLDGDTPQDLRQNYVERFQKGELPVFVSTIGAGGVGITLTKASTVIMVDRPFTPGDAEQAEDRLNRIGQTQNVSAIWIQATVVDEAIDALLEAKADNIELVLNGKKKRLSKGMSEQKLVLELLETLYE